MAYISMGGWRSFAFAPTQDVAPDGFIEVRLSDGSERLAMFDWTRGQESWEANGFRAWRPRIGVSPQLDAAIDTARKAKP